MHSYVHTMNRLSRIFIKIANVQHCKHVSTYAAMHTITYVYILNDVVAS